MTINDRPTAVPSSVRMGPAVKGSYALVLRLGRGRRLKIGKLGAFDFPAGYYLYLGSALGGLDTRVRRHLDKAKRHHWHIDRLTAVAPVVQVWWAAGTERLECTWATAVLDLPGVAVPAPGFGSSDCTCASHLVLLPDTPDAVGSARERVRTSRPAVSLRVTRMEATASSGTDPRL